MHQGIRGPRVVAAVLLAILASIALAACGSSSSSSSEDAATLLKQTFTGSHKVSSGNLNLAVTVDPSGSTTLSGPIKLSFGGPFQSSAQRQAPAVELHRQRQRARQERLAGAASRPASRRTSRFRAPAISCRRRRSRSSSRASRRSAPPATAAARARSPSSASSRWTGCGTRRSSAPRAWVARTPRTSRASINVAALLNDFSTFLQKASTLGVSGASSGVQGAVGHGAQPDRRRGQEPPVRPVDRQQRQDASQADDRADGAGQRRHLDAARRAALGRHRADHAVRGRQPAADDRGPQDCSSLQRVHQQGADVPADRCRARSGSSLLRRQLELVGLGEQLRQRLGLIELRHLEQGPALQQLHAAAGSDVAKMQRCASLLNGK